MECSLFLETSQRRTSSEAPDSSTPIPAVSMVDIDPSLLLHEDPLRRCRSKHLEDPSPHNVIARLWPTASNSIHRSIHSTNGATPLRSSSLPIIQSPLRHFYLVPPHPVTTSSPRGTGFGARVLVEHDDDTLLVGSPVPHISTPPITTASSSTIIIPRSTGPLNPSNTTLRGSSTSSPLLPISPNYASTHSSSPASSLGPISPPSRDMVPFVCPSTKHTFDLMSASQSDDYVLPLLVPSQTFWSNPISQEGEESVLVDSGHLISMKLPIMSRREACLSSSSSKRIFGDTTPLHMPVPRRIHNCPTILEHERASTETPLRVFGNSVVVEDEDYDTSPAGYSSPTTASPHAMTSSSSTNLGSRFSNSLDAYRHRSGSPFSHSSFSIYPNHSNFTSSMPCSPGPSQAQKTPTIPVQRALPPAPAAATTWDASPTYRSSANKFNFMGAPLVQSPIPWTQRHEDTQLKREKPPSEGTTLALAPATGRDRVSSQPGDPIGPMDVDLPHPVRARSQRRPGPHRKPPARPRGESSSSAGIFTNAQVKEISGGIFHNVAHIYESDPPAPGGGLAFQFAALSLQAVFFALLSFLLPNNSTILTGTPINQPRRIATTLIPPLGDDARDGPTYFMSPHQDESQADDR